MKSNKTFTKQEFRLIISQTRDIHSENIFTAHRFKNAIEGITDTWTNRFDSAELFNKAGLTTGQELHFFNTCNN